MKIIFNKAGNGDCFLIRNHSTSILIDGGTSDSYCQWKVSLEGIDALDALVITHIDSDHTNGVIEFLKENSSKDIESPIVIKQIYFNGAQQILDLPLTEETDVRTERVLNSIESTFSENSRNNREIGFNEGTSLSYLIESLGYKINESLDGEALYREKNKTLVVGDINLTIIGPEKIALIELKEAWGNLLSEKRLKPKVLTREHFRPFDTFIQSLKTKHSGKEISAEKEQTIVDLAKYTFAPDKSLANKSSISFLLNFNDKRILFLADSHEQTIINWLDENNIPVLEVDAVKLPHHGSKKNFSEILARRIVSTKYLISTNGNKENHPHPNKETIAKIIVNSKIKDLTFFFNYQPPHIDAAFIKDAEQYGDIKFAFHTGEIDL